MTHAYLLETVAFDAGGDSIRSLEELARWIKSAGDDRYQEFNNARKNDFSQWILDCVGDKRLARRLRNVRIRQNFLKILDDRITVLKDYARHPSKAKIEKRIDMYRDHVEFVVDNELCCDCDMCSLVCPVEAVEIKNGKKTISDKCTKCGYCANFCPVGAISSKVNGKVNDLYAEKKMIPALPGTETVHGHNVRRFVSGTHAVTCDCPTGCELCVPACPINIITRFDGATEQKRIHVWKEKCLQCGSCKNACPYGLIHIERNHVWHDGSGYSQLWNRTIEKLTKPEHKNLLHGERNISKIKSLIEKSGLRKH
jgi:formate hydrogenlyase subunit 6/NADH:ubiquinone oxidoreductase subunit I